MWEALTLQLKALDASAASTGLWDLRQIGQLDHLGAQVLWDRWGRQWPDKLEVPPAQRAVLDRVAQFSTDRPKPTTPSFRESFLSLGASVLRVVDHGTDLMALVGRLMLNLIKLARNPREGPWRDFSGHLYHIGATALPITALVGFLIGVVLAYLISQQLRQFGAEAIVMPLISVWTTIAALLGGMLAADLVMGVTPSYFINSLPDAVETANLTLATAKSVVFGVLIALIGCHFGLRVKPNTESLGQGTTSSVVTSITVVILVDALFAVLFKSIGI